MTVKLIIAVDQGNAIGWSDGRLPWKIPADMKRFKELTTNSNVVMGFNTFKSLNRKDGLPNRDNFVLSRKPWSEVRGMTGDNVSIISNLDYLKVNTNLVKFRRGQDLWICGGAQVYAEALEKQMVDEIYLTRVHTASSADVVLPIDLYSWKLFVIRQRSLGVNWDLVEGYEPSVNPESPSITFLTFKRLP